MLKNGGIRHWIPEMEVPYAVRGDQWVGYDDEQSLRLKVRPAPIMHCVHTGCGKTSSNKESILITRGLMTPLPSPHLGDSLKIVDFPVFFIF